MKRQEIVNVVRAILKKYAIREAYFFGSFARKEKYNDIDIVITPPPKFSLFDLVGLSQDIEERVGIKTDVITKRSINKHLKKYIMRDLVAI